MSDGNLSSNPHAKWLRKLEQHLRSEKAHAYANTVEQAADEIDRLQCEVEQFVLALRRIGDARDQNVSSGEAGAVGKSETPTGGVGNQMPGPGSSPGTALSPEFRAAEEPLSTDDMDESGRDGFFQNVGYTGTANGFIVRDGTYWIATFRTGAEADAYAEWRNADEPAALPSQLLDVHAICDERDRLRRGIFGLAHKFMNDGRTKEAAELGELLNGAPSPPSACPECEKLREQIRRMMAENPDWHLKLRAPSTKVVGYVNPAPDAAAPVVPTGLSGETSGPRGLLRHTLDCDLVKYPNCTRCNCNSESEEGSL